MAEYYVVSMSHIDMAFVMREEAYEECLDILLERVIGVLERNPEIHFALEQTAHYRKLQNRRQDLYQMVKELLRTGRMEFLGGMATTAETNFPNGECLVRNQGMGLIWLEEHFGVKPCAGWLLDTFGINVQVPQIMKQFGFRHLYANRFGGDKHHDTFYAEGLDGTRLLITGKDSASGNVLPDSQAFFFCRSWHDVDQLFREAEELSGDMPKLVTYYIENEEVFSGYYLKLAGQKIAQGQPWKHATYGEYEKALEAYREELEKGSVSFPVLHGDLNPEFTGTFALRTSIKTENRIAETALLDAEKWEALLGNGGEDPFEDSWWDLFICQFHDAFTGSHEDITHRNIMGKFYGIERKAAQVQREALQLESSCSVVCVNSLPWPRKEWVESGNEISRESSGKRPQCAEGKIQFAECETKSVWKGEEKLPQCVRDGKLYFLAEVPAGGMRRYDLREERAVVAPLPDAETAARPGEIRNEYLRLVLSERNGMESLEDNQGNRFLAQGWDFLSAGEDQGGMQIEACQGNEVYATMGEVSLDKPLTDAMGERIVMKGMFPLMRWNKENRLSWKAEFSLRRGEKGLRIRLTLDWKGDRTRIRLKVPCAMEGRDVCHEVPFGVVRREPYHNRPTAKGEWPVQRFAAWENGTMGVALLNRGVAGVEQDGGKLVTTLVRAYGSGPDAWVSPTDLSCQNGEQTFEFMILPYLGDYREAQVQKAAQEFNQQMTVYGGRSSLFQEEKSWFEVKGDGLVLSAMKRAWDHSPEMVVRLYESKGRHTAGRLRIEGMKEAWQSDMREAKGERIPCEGDELALEFRPFEIKTLRIKR